MAEAILSRLEAVAARLEAHASKLGSSVFNTIHSNSGSGDSASLSEGAQAWLQLEGEELAKFVSSARAQPETKQMGDWAETAFRDVGVLLRTTSSSKKPSDQELLDFLKPVVDILNNSSKTDNRSPFINHQKGFNEGIQSLTWVTINPPSGLPKEAAQGGLEAADFWLIKILTEGKKKGGAEGEKYTAFASTLKQLLSKQVEIVSQYYKTGLEWNPKGKPLSEAKVGGSSSFISSDAPPPPPPPSTFFEDIPTTAAASAKPTTGGLGAVFGELTSKNVTAGLKKVTDNMKTKNMKDIPTLETKPVGKSAASPATKVAAPKKEPKTSSKQGTWFIEDYEGGEVVLKDILLKESVYIVKCKNTTVIVPVKCKSVQVDGCNRCHVEFKNVVSSLEIFNSQRIQAHCTEAVPTVNIDKSGGVSIQLSREATANPPQIITSSVTELNLVVPGKTDEDDPIEIPLPEQYLTVYKDGKLHTEAVAHSAN